MPTPRSTSPAFGRRADEHAAVPSLVRRAIRSSGRPLDSDVRADMESRFGHDFSRVRVHTDGRAAESARPWDANAYTLGSEIVFRDGAYAPRTGVGRARLAHELAHVVQQGRGGLPHAAEREAEAEADRAAVGAHRGAPAPVQLSTPLAVACQKADSGTKKPTVRKGDEVARLLVMLDSRQVIVEMKSGDRFFYDLKETNLPIKPEESKASFAGSLRGGELLIENAENAPSGWTLYFKGSPKEDPDPGTLPFPAKFTIDVERSSATAGTEGPIGGAPGTGPEPSSDAGAVNVPTVIVDTEEQIEQLQAKGLIDAATAGKIRTKLEGQQTLTFDEALTLVEALHKVVVQGSKEEAAAAQESWLAWAKFVKENEGKILKKSTTKGGGLTVEDVRSIIATYNQYVGVQSPPSAAGKAKPFDAKSLERHKSWNMLDPWEQKFWREYLAHIEKTGRLGEAEKALLASDRTDLRIDSIDRLSMAVSLAPDHITHAGLKEAARETFTNPWFLGGVAASMGVYVAAWLSPDIFSKGAAAAVTTAMLIYFTLEDLRQLATIWVNLVDGTKAARSFDELNEAARKFGKAVNERIVQMFVMLLTLAIGETVKLAKEGPGSGAAPSAEPAPALQPAFAGASEFGMPGPPFSVSIPSPRPAGGAVAVPGVVGATGATVALPPALGTLGMAMQQTGEGGGGDQDDETIDQDAPTEQTGEPTIAQGIGASATNPYGGDKFIFTSAPDLYKYVLKKWKSHKVLQDLAEAQHLTGPQLKTKVDEILMDFTAETNMPIRWADDLPLNDLISYRQPPGVLSIRPEGLKDPALLVKKLPHDLAHFYTAQHAGEGIYYMQALKGNKYFTANNFLEQIIKSGGDLSILDILKTKPKKPKK
jgi:hypothetical protein